MSRIQTPRRVPISPEDYIAQEQECDRQGRSVKGSRCTGCFGGEAVASDGANLLCAACWSWRHGFDTAEEKFVRSLVGAAIAAALYAGASAELVHMAVDDALAQRTILEQLAVA